MAKEGVVVSDPIWNVTVRIVELIAAPTAAEAQERMSDRLTRCGFTQYEDNNPNDAFESEPLDPEEEAAIRAETALHLRPGTTGYVCDTTVPHKER